MWLDKNKYPVKPDGTVEHMHLTLYFSEWRGKFHERQVQNKLVKAKRDASQQAKDITPKAQSNVMTPPLPPAREGHDFPGIQSKVLGLTRHHARAKKSPSWFMVWTPRISRSQMGTR